MGSSTRVPNPHDLFTRRTIHDGGQTLLASYCLRCSAVMFSSLAEVELVETSHLKWCFRPALPDFLRRRSGRPLLTRNASPLPATPAGERAMAAPARLPARARFYIRRIIWAGERALIESRCTRCGSLVIGSVTESLIQDEDAHLKQCAAQPDEETVWENSPLARNRAEQRGHATGSPLRRLPCQSLDTHVEEN